MKEKGFYQPILLVIFIALGITVFNALILGAFEQEVLLTRGTTLQLKDFNIELSACSQTLTETLSSSEDSNDFARDADGRVQAIGALSNFVFDIFNTDDDPESVDDVDISIRYATDAGILSTNTVVKGLVNNTVVCVNSAYPDTGGSGSFSTVVFDCDDNVAFGPEDLVNFKVNIFDTNNSLGIYIDEVNVSTDYTGKKRNVTDGDSFVTGFSLNNTGASNLTNGSLYYFDNSTEKHLGDLTELRGGTSNCFTDTGTIKSESSFLYVFDQGSIKYDIT